MVFHSLQRIIIHYYNLHGCSNCPRFGYGELSKLISVSFWYVLRIFWSTFLLSRTTRHSRLIYTFWAPGLEPATYTRRKFDLFFLIFALGLEFSCWLRNFQLYFEKNKEKAKDKAESDKPQWNDCKTQVWRRSWVSRSVIESELPMQALSPCVKYTTGRATMDFHLILENNLAWASFPTTSWIHLP